MLNVRVDERGLRSLTLWSLYAAGRRQTVQARMAVDSEAPQVVRDVGLGLALQS